MEVQVFKLWGNLTSKQILDGKNGKKKKEKEEKEEKERKGEREKGRKGEREKGRKGEEEEYFLNLAFIFVNCLRAGLAPFLD